MSRAPSPEIASRDLARREQPTAAALLIVCCGLLAAWAASESLGLLGHPLRRGASVVALLTAVLAAASYRPYSAWRIGLLVVAAAAGIVMIATPWQPMGVLAPVVVLLAARIDRAPLDQRLLLLAAQAVVLLAVYRIVYLSAAPAWYAADWIAQTISHPAGAVAGWIATTVGALAAAVGTMMDKPPLGLIAWQGPTGTLDSGPTLAGLDFLVPMLFVAVGWSLIVRRSEERVARSLLRVSVAVLAVLAVHFVYLVVLGLSPYLMRLLPEYQPRPSLVGDVPRATFFESLRGLIPWNLPAVAAALHLLLVGVGVRWLARRAASSQQGTMGFSPLPTYPRLRIVWAVVGLALAAALPAVTHLDLWRPSLDGKKIVFYEKGFLNWLKPEHGQYGRVMASGMYGMMPDFLDVYGAKAIISPDLSPRDLEGADAVVLFFPNRKWEDGQLERLWQFVSDGGGLLVMGEHTIEEEGGGNRFNEVLEPTGMYVKFDSATFAVGGWLQSYDAFAHPTTAGIGDEQNDFGVVIGASMGAAWPARPLLVGRLGWADPGDVTRGESKMGNHLYDEGERLGDMILAAEQPLGKGKIVAFGDTSGLTNGLLVNDHEFVSRLLAYVADGPHIARSPARQTLALAVAAALLVVALWPPGAWRLGLMTLALAGSLAVCGAASQRAATLLPDGRMRRADVLADVRPQPLPAGDVAVALTGSNKLAYVDASQYNLFSREGWRDDSLGGLTFALKRDGYVPMMLRELSPERLLAPEALADRRKLLELPPGQAIRAQILVEVAPGKDFTSAQRELVKDFVAAGGILIYTVGYEDAGPSRPLLAEFGLRVGETRRFRGPPPREPVPAGYFKSPYFQGDGFEAFVRFYTGWPVEADPAPFGPAADPPPRVLAYSKDDAAAIVARRYRRGMVVLVGDTCFAMNKNLELESGAPFDGMYENADFWRWLLALLNERQPWYPAPQQEVVSD